MQSRQSIQDLMVPIGLHLPKCCSASVPRILVRLRFLLQRCLCTSGLSPCCALVQECPHLYIPSFKTHDPKPLLQKAS